MGTTPAELTTVTTVAHSHFGPRTWLAGRRLRSHHCLLAACHPPHGRIPMACTLHRGRSSAQDRPSNQPRPASSEPEEARRSRSQAVTFASFHVLVTSLSTGFKAGPAGAATRRHRGTGLTLPTGLGRSNHQATQSTRPARCPTSYIPNQASTPAWSQGWYQNSEILPSRKCTTKTSLVEKVSPPRRMVPRCRTIPCSSSAR